MDKLTYPLDPEKPALCVSTIDYLTAHGFISPANDSGVTLQTVLQELQTGDGDEQDELTDDDENDEQLAAQFIEPKGPNPQQQMFLEKPSGPNLLVEASKALIKREPVPPEASLLPGKSRKTRTASFIVYNLTETPVTAASQSTPPLFCSLQAVTSSSCHAPYSRTHLHRNANQPSSHL